MTEHRCWTYDCYMANGWYAFCECGWKSPVYSYRWVNENYGEERMKEFREFLLEQFLEYHSTLGQ